MQSNKHNNINTITFENLLGDKKYNYFLQIQSSYGIAHRGGVSYPDLNKKHLKRLVTDVNLLTSKENKQLVFSEIIFSN